MLKNIAKDKTQELGFGTKAEQTQRLINKDGSFNVDRKEKSKWESISIYHYLISISWTKFNLWVLLYFIVINLIFTTLYVSIGTNGINGIEGQTKFDTFLESFFFSTQTLSTVGYGKMSPANHIISIIAAIEALVGLLGFALATGVLYGRFSRPKAKIMFSENAIIAPFKDGKAFQFRIANRMRNSQIVDLEARVTVSKLEIENGIPIRRFRPLELELKRIIFFPMTWTINHPIDENSPLWGMTEEEIKKSNAEFMILLSGFDDTFSQTVNTRFSYTWEELVYGAKFVSVYCQTSEGKTVQDMNKIDLLEKHSF